MRVARILFGLVIVVVGVGALALIGLYASQPASYRIERSRTLSAPPARVLSFLTDVRAFESWDPWPSATPPTITYSPTTSGVGAWVERRDTDGAGARTTLVSISPDRVEMENVTSGGPLGGGRSRQTFELRARDGGTEISWALSSELHGLGRMIWPFVHLEDSVHHGMDEALTRLEAASR